ncbi:MAG: hypothetical protein ACOC55_03440 [Candidatus Natronoplasma sp.]
MGIKVTFKEWITLLIMLSVFIAITGFLITFYLNISGPVVMMVALVIIFVVFKLYKWKKDEDGSGKKENEDDKES